MRRIFTVLQDDWHHDVEVGVLEGRAIDELGMLPITERFLTGANAVESSKSIFDVLVSKAGAMKRPSKRRP